MSKSLSESAAEILSASVGKADKEPMKKGPGDAQEVGGSTNEMPAGPDNPGAKAAAGINKVAAPDVKGDAKAVKVSAMEEVETDEEIELTEEELDEYLNSLSEEELAALAEELEADEDSEELTEEELAALDEASKPNLKMSDYPHFKEYASGALRARGEGAPKSDTEIHHSVKGHLDRAENELKTAKQKGHNLSQLGADADEGKHGGFKHAYKMLGKAYYNFEEVDQVEEAAPELTEEEIAEARKAAMKEMVAKNMGSCKEDIDALFNGEALSDEFRGKAITIFEAAVRARVEAIAENLFAENEEILADTVASIEEDLANNVDEYLNYVVEHWMSENELAIESGLRTEIAEEFMDGLKNLFTECYMEVPEEKADLVEEMAERVVTAEEALVQVHEELVAAKKVINEVKANEILSLTCEGLTKVQVEKIRALAEGVEFTTEGEYKQKLAVIRENYFPTKSVKSEAPQTVVETSEGEKEVSGIMDHYVKAISKSLPK